MPVEGDRVGPVDAVEQWGEPVGEERAAAVGGVDVEPGAVPGGEVGDVVQRVDGSGVGGAGGGDDGDRGGALPAGLGEGVGQRFGFHAELAVDGDGADGAFAEAEQRGGALDGEVGGLGGQDPGADVVRDAVQLDVGAESLVAGEHQAHQVGLGAAGGEHAGRAFGPEADGAGEFGEEFALQGGGGGGLVPGVLGRVEGADREVGGDRDGQRRAVQVRGAGRVRRVGGAVRQQFHQLAERAGALGVGEGRPYRLRDRLRLSGDHRAAAPYRPGGQGRQGLGDQRPQRLGAGHAAGEFG